MRGLEGEGEKEMGRWRQKGREMRWRGEEREREVVWVQGEG